MDDPITTQRSHPLRSLPSRSWDSGIDTLVTYLWGISLGAVLFSIVMAALLAVPILLDPNLTVLVSFAGAKGRGEEGLGSGCKVWGWGATGGECFLVGSTCSHALLPCGGTLLE